MTKWFIDDQRQEWQDEIDKMTHTNRMTKWHRHNISHSVYNIMTQNKAKTKQQANMTRDKKLPNPCRPWGKKWLTNFITLDVVNKWPYDFSD